MFKDYLLRKMMERQLKDIPKEQRYKMIEMVTQNPELFQKIAVEIKAKMDNGMDQMTAARDVLSKYQNELPKMN